MSRIKFVVGERAFIAGISGFGKSTVIMQIMEDSERFVCFDSEGEYVEKYPTAYNTERLIELLEANTPRIVYSSDDKYEFNNVCRIVYAAENNVLIVDEVSKFCNPQGMPVYMDKILNYGRKHGVGFIGVSRRPARVHPDVIYQANKILVFGLKGFRDIEYFKACGFPGIQKAQTLPRYSFLYYDDVDCKVKEYDGNYSKKHARLIKS